MTALKPGQIGAADDSPHSDGDAAAYESLQTAPILMIGRDPNLMSYRSAVLATANFSVQSVSPTHAHTILQNGADYDLVIFSHTLDAAEVLEMEQTLRRRKPGTRLLLILGPGDAPLDPELFDATMHGLDGPAAFIRAVRELAGQSRKPNPGTQNSRR